MADLAARDCNGNASPAPRPNTKGKNQPSSLKPASGPGLEAISLGKSCFSLAVSFLIDLSIMSFSVKAKR